MGKGLLLTIGVTCLLGIAEPTSAQEPKEMLDEFITGSFSGPAGIDFPYSCAVPGPVAPSQARSPDPVLMAQLRTDAASRLAGLKLNRASANDERKLLDLFDQLCVLKEVEVNKVEKDKWTKEMRGLLAQFPVPMTARVTGPDVFLKFVESHRSRASLDSLIGTHPRVVNVDMKATDFDYMLRYIEVLLLDRSSLQDETQKLRDKSEALQAQCNLVRGIAQVDGLVLGDVFASINRGDIQKGGKASLDVSFIPQPNTPRPPVGFPYAYVLEVVVPNAQGTNVVADMPDRQQGPWRQDIARAGEASWRTWHYDVIATQDVARSIELRPTVRLLRYPEHADIGKDVPDHDFGDVKLHPDVLKLNAQESHIHHLMATLWAALSAPTFGILGFFSRRWYESRLESRLEPARLARLLVEELEANQRQLAKGATEVTVRSLRHGLWDDYIGKLDFLGEEDKRLVNRAYDSIVRSQAACDMQRKHRGLGLHSPNELQEAVGEIQAALPSAIKTLKGHSERVSIS